MGKARLLKRYRLGTNGLHYLRSAPVKALLVEHGLPAHMVQVDAITAGASKAEALSFLRLVGEEVGPSEVKIGMGNDVQHLAEAKLLPEEGEREGSWWPGVFFYPWQNSDGTPVVVLRLEYDEPRIAGWWRTDRTGTKYVEVTGD